MSSENQHKTFNTRGHVTHLPSCQAFENFSAVMKHLTTAASLTTDIMAREWRESTDGDEWSTGWLKRFRQGCDPYEKQRRAMLGASQPMGGPNGHRCALMNELAACVRAADDAMALEWLESVDDDGDGWTVIGSDEWLSAWLESFRYEADPYQIQNRAAHPSLWVAMAPDYPDAGYVSDE